MEVIFPAPPRQLPAPKLGLAALGQLGALVVLTTLNPEPRLALILRIVEPPQLNQPPQKLNRVHQSLLTISPTSPSWSLTG